MTVQYTPAMQQYVNIKKDHPDCLLFFRIGDFYETFFEDAKIAAKILDLLITSKNKNAEDPIPMAGIPHHSIDKYIPKLVAHGYKVAIAEQTSEPVAGKLVDREVTQIITPATFIQEGKAQTTSIVAVTLLEQSEGNFHLAWGDFSLGEYWTKSFHSIEELGKHIVLLRPVECIVDSLFPQKDDLIAMIHRSITCQISLADIPHRPQEYLMEQCRVQTLASYGKAAEHARGSALALLFGYLQSTQKKNLTNISRISYEGSDHR
ncbi:MAG: DNA mismatch repair protein MutS, partial [Candidatus Absconditabacteria bacterium]